MKIVKFWRALWLRLSVRSVQSLTLGLVSLFCAIALSSTLPFNPPASATEINPHAYLIERLTKVNNGGYVRLVNGQQDLNCNCSSSSSRPSINKEMWVIFEGQPNVFEWLEAGQKRGLQLASFNEDASNPNASQVHWEGHFLGKTLFESSAGQIVSRSTPYSAQNPTGSATYQIKYSGSGTSWVIYVNGYQAYTVSTGFQQANYIDVGVESKDTLNTFTNGTYSDQWQYLSGANFYNVSTQASSVAGLRQNLYNNNWNVNFSSTANKVTFSN